MRRLHFEPEVEAAFVEQHTAATIGRVRVVFTVLALFGLAGLLGRDPNSDRAVAAVDYAFTLVFFVLLGLAFLHRFRHLATPSLAVAAVLSQIAIGLTAKSALPAAGIIFNLLYLIIVIATLQARFKTALLFGTAMVAARAWTFSYRGMWADETVLFFSLMVVEAIFLCLASYLNEVRDRKSFLFERSLRAEKERTKALVQNVLPPTIADQLSRDPGTIARQHESATVLFADLVGFTPFAEKHSPNEVVGMLNDVFSRFDALVKESPAVKIKTVGDCYMVAGGIPDPDPNHVANVANLALELRGAANAAGISIRMGIHMGPLISGVLGTERLMYDIWGPTVNFASRLESSAEAGQILVSRAVREALAETHDLEPQGELDLKGLGLKEVFLLQRRKIAPMELV
ncbi:MAG: adenylate/guanylate cyclase domain-containing protein [Armatimonadetes bacterium]|nr:adenylate/guanylate cyclase domain-containing protein [Armatimonadota bacterium]